MGHQHVGFGQWAERYDDGVQGRVARWFYRAVLTTDVPAGCRVLDVGCGTGRLLSLLAERGAVGSGVEIAPEMVAVARRANPQMDIRQGTAEDLPFADATSDLVVTCLAYHHLDAPERFLAEAARVLVPQGRLVVAEPRLGLLRRPLNALFRAHDHVERFGSLAEIRGDLERSGFTLVRTRARGVTGLVEVRRP
ncbi:MAG: methyltransferase domain-containing protein [Micrococcales bacterium]|nr:methyltransferase domain-containing protein [Micrococcales bacterium]